ncbi:hypothetical protein TRVA0_017S00210 [Trichomonascus vanleenenianus]|uniref:uncharacterized protein n=1 Tax=Trichomonascus vanleenenianus TaxID=2268995 RepID=UPI003ECAC0E2
MFVAYGTPLESSQKKQTDRLHGAFTGGFSAGYYNSVGSKEGWAPSSYVVTRDSKQIRPASTVEDFMDEEDRADYEDRVVLSYAPEYNPEYAPPAESAVQRTFQSSLETAGFKLLQSMGWKEGQGIGPATEKSIDVGGKRQVVQLAPRGGSSGVKRSATIKKDTRKRPMNLSIADDLDEDDEDDSMFVKRSKTALTGVKKKIQPKVKFVGAPGKVKAKGFDGLPPLAGFIIRDFYAEKVYKVDVPDDFLPDLQPKKSSIPPPIEKKEPPPVTLTNNSREPVPGLDSAIAQQALSGKVLPYRDDSEKQRRYVEFLERSAESKAETLQPANRDRREWINELKDFCRSAQMFRPLSGAMADKFTSSGTFVTESRLSPHEEAARSESYGPRTRVVTAFIPEKLLCTRMHVAYRGSEKEKGSLLDIDDFLLTIKKQVETEKNESIEINPERNEALEAKPASPDLFKAVFGDGDVEEEL